MEVNQGTIRTLHTGYSAIFNRVLNTAPNDWAKVARKVPSTTRRNEYSWMRNMPQLKRDLGAVDIENLIRHGYTIENERYKSFIAVDVDDIEDDNLGSYAGIFEDHATEAANWVTHAVFSLLPMGITADGKSFDGESFFSASHPRIDGTTWANFANDSGAPWYLLDTSRPIKPLIFQERKPLYLTVKDKDDDDNVFEEDKIVWAIKGRFGFGYSYPQLAYCSEKTLDATNLEAAITAMLGFTRDDGAKLNIKPTTLVVGPSNWIKARKLLELMNNDAGASNIHKGSLELVYSQFCEEVSLDIHPSVSS